MSCRIESIVQHLHQVNPDTPILLLGMVAMADQEEPNAEGVFPWPNKFTAATEMLNEQLDQVAIRLDDVHYHDCHHVLLADRGVSFLFFLG